MQIRQVIIFVAGLFVGLLVAIGTWSQANGPSLGNLSVQKHEVSKLDWVLLDARVTALESTPLNDFSRWITPLDFAYDEQRKKIVARGFVSPDWFSQTDLQGVKAALTKRAVDFCGVAVASALMKEGSSLGLAWQNNCYVRFVTWWPDKTNSVASKDVALFENGQLFVK
jgi:hypothetical protein